MNTVLSDTMQTKETALKALLRGYDAIAIAYSGGVDSTYLADVAHEVLGTKARMVLADSPSLPRSELKEARALAESRGWNFVRVETHEFEQENFLKNDGGRCYVCKGELFTQMDRYAR